MAIDRGSLEASKSGQLARLARLGVVCGLVLAAAAVGRELLHRTHWHRTRWQDGAERGGDVRAVARSSPGPARAVDRPLPPPGRKLPRRQSAVPAARRLYSGAAVLATSVLADSTLEHYRAYFFRPAMYAAPSVSAVTLATSVSAAASTEDGGWARDGVYAVAVLTGLAGTGFHLYNVGKREGGFSWLNLFYGAPLGAPAAISLAGLFGLAARRLAGDTVGGPPKLLGVPAGPALAALAAAGLMGTVGEAALLHFRGAFQDPFMYLPVTVPPVAAAALAAAALRPTPARQRVAAAALCTTSVLGLAGVGFHAYGIHRNMGGWRNWSQMILQGPPLPAPPGFTGVALAGLGALQLLEHPEEER